jgi:hypothetical protein
MQEKCYSGMMVLLFIDPVQNFPGSPWGVTPFMSLMKKDGVNGNERRQTGLEIGIQQSGNRDSRWLM